MSVDALNGDASDHLDKVRKWFKQSKFVDHIRLCRRVTDKDDEHYLEPGKRGNKAFHILTTSTLDELHRLTGISQYELYMRLRANMLINNSGFEPFEELKWKSLRTESGVELIDLYGTHRCDVPGRNPATAEKEGDLVQLYPSLPKQTHDGKTKTVIGLYGTLGSEPGTMFMNEQVEVEYV